LLGRDLVPLFEEAITPPGRWSSSSKERKDKHVHASKAQLAADTFAEAKQLRRAGFRKQAIESLLTALELGVDVLATHHQVAIKRSGMGLHAGRKAAAQELCAEGRVVRKVVWALCTVDRDRQAVRYEGRDSRLTEAQVESLVGLVASVVRGAQQLS